MKRRTFIKGLVAALLSPFVARGTATPKAAIPDPEFFDHPMEIFTDGLQMSHVHDAVRYGTMMDRRFWDEADYLRGDQWPESYTKRMARDQRKLNHSRSLIINKISGVKLKNSLKGYKYLG